MPAAGQTTKPLVELPKGAADGPCWPWLGATDTRGYPIKEYCGRTMRAQRWLWLSLFGPIPEEVVVSTSCGDPGCMNPGHFRGMSVAGVNQEVRGSLVPDEVQAIRRSRENRTRGEAQRLADKHDIHRSTVYRIWSGRSWKRAKKRKVQHG